MKKLLSLLLTILMVITVFSATPIISAEETEHTVISYEMRRKYWTSILCDGILKIGDWYYGFNTNNSTKENYIIAVCGYEGNEAVITIPTEVEGYNINYIMGFRLFSDTVETIKIPKEITYIRDDYDGDPNIGLSRNKSYFKFNKTTNFKEIIVDSENEKFMSKDGVLFSKSGYTLYFYPPKKLGTEYMVPSTVGTIETGALWYLNYLKSLTIPQSVRYICEYSISESLEKLYFDNTRDIITDTKEHPSYYEGGIFEGPKVRKGTIYCIYATPLYEYYNKSWNKGYFYKELKVIPRKDGESLIKEDGVWYYYDNGEKTKRSTLIKHSGKWFYVSNGVWDKTVSDKIIKYKEKWFYIKNGKWNSSINTLVKIGNEWLGIVNGKLDTSTKTLIKYKGKWFYIKNGKWCKDTAIVKYKGKRFYVKKGKIDFDYSGKKKIDGKTYKIKNGKVA